MMGSPAGYFTVSRTSKFSSRTAEELRSLRQEDKLMDFKIHILEKTIRCHRLVLCLHSPVLKAMILTDMAEGSSQEMRLDSVQHSIMKMLVDYMYWGGATFKDSALVQIVHACDYLQLTELRDLCISRAPHILTPGNALSWFKLACQLELEDIKQQCSSLMTTNFVKVTSEVEFLGLSHEEVIYWLQNACEKDVQSDDLLRSAFTWTNHDTNNRHEYMNKVLSQIKIEKCSMTVLKEMMIRYTQLLDYCPSVFKLFTSCLINVIEDITQPVSRDRKAFLVIGGHKGTERNDKCWKIHDNDHISEFTQVPSEACAKYNSICATPDGFILTGGENSNICLMFYVATQSWKRHQNMLRNRYCHGSAFVSGILFVVSEYNHGNGSASMDYLDVKGGGSWQEGPPAPTALPWPKVASLDSSSVYVLDSTSSFFRLDVQSKVWTRRASLPGRGWSVSVSSAAGKMYVAGGRNNICCCYTPATDTWVQLIHKPSQRHYDGAMTTVQRGRKLMLLGGGSNDVEECHLDAENPCWTVANFQLPMAVKFHAAFELSLKE